MPWAHKLLYINKLIDYSAENMMKLTTLYICNTRQTGKIIVGKE
jgi:hypothetical protein